ncbi:hypothetical protein BP5796_02703 [Coleophoma crateriformis]|uniref:Xylanolytic transcriptional activator regulatory domain-containing protein n=1 Tax=Coleophoma crateriformis TaxID=565419 RepID=A0A3D8T0K4_9HELO|nr:hypothetical protein BP5796_02703 [Coleophoma crateriformis]
MDLTDRKQCDGTRPTCSACVTVYNTECFYDIDSDRRRKGALKRDIKHLIEDNERREFILDALRNAADADLDDVVQIIRSDRTYEAIAEALENLNLNLTTRNHSERPTLEGELADFVGKPCTDKDGQTRLYGHTSNLAILGNDEAVHSKAIIEAVTWTKVTSDVEFIKHLFNLYFAWSHPFYVLFPQETFFKAMRDRNTKYCSPLLVNAVLAVGCHFSDRPEARADPKDPSTVGEHFFAEARRILCDEVQSDAAYTMLTTVQALGVMSLKSAMTGADSPGWKFSSSMMAMSIELGLQTSLNTLSNSKISAIEDEARRVTFWGCYVLHTAWAICIGRISLMPQAAITVDKVPLKDSLEIKPWTPFGCPQREKLVQAGYTYTVLGQTAMLTEIVNEAVHMFYAPQGRTTSRKVLDLHFQMQRWYAQLPEALAVQPEGHPTTAQVFALHIYYHNCVLHLFRPFLRVTFVQAAKPPHLVCMESARAITQLVALYKHYYGLRRVPLIVTHCTMTAAIQHLVNLSSAKHDVATQAAADLGETISAISNMAQRAPMSKRFFAILMGLIRRWAVKVPENVQNAMAEAEVEFASTESSSSVNMSPPLILSSSTNSEETLRRNDPGPEPMPRPGLMNDHSSRPVPTSQPLQLGPNPFWTPFPGAFDGLPVAHPVPEAFLPQQHMDISCMLDSGVDGDWAQLNRDGFTMANAGVGLDPNLWKWNGNLQA